MTVVELAQLVAEMRAAQRRYFRGRTSDRLRIAKDVETKVDEAVSRVLDDLRLFDTEDG